MSKLPTDEKIKDAIKEKAVNIKEILQKRNINIQNRLKTQASNEIESTIDSNLNRQHRIKDRFLFDLVPGIGHFDQSKTKQSFAEEADINNIMRKYIQTGVLVDPLIPRNRKPQYGDFSITPDYFTALREIRKAESEFNLLPSKLRDKFENSLENLLNFLADPANNAEAVEMGLKSAPLKSQSPEGTKPQATQENVSNSESDAKKAI